MSEKPNVYTQAWDDKFGTNRVVLDADKRRYQCPQCGRSEAVSAREHAANSVCRRCYRTDYYRALIMY